MKPVWICRRTSADLLGLACPRRDREAHKGMFGRVLIIGGAEGYTGAPYFAAQSALRSGAGLIFVGVPRSVYPIVASKLHEQMVFPLEDKEGKISADALPGIYKRLKTADVCLLGPGLGTGPEQKKLVHGILSQCTCPIVLDADGINAVSGHIDLLREAVCPIVLTPHEGEFRRLTDALEADRISGAITFAHELGVIVVRKGHTTVITDGEKTYLNKTGNPGMATGGSGDVLAGIIASFIGQGVTPLTAAASAAWLHGMAGDLAASKYGEYAMVPSDLIEQLPRLLP